MLSLMSRALRPALRVAARPLEPLLPSKALASAVTTRPFTRSLWLLGSASTPQRPGLLLSHRGLPSMSCGCGALHTEGDKAFAEFLTDEIKEEVKIKKHTTLPKMTGGWELELNGTEAKLVRKISGETITVTFNTNNSIPPSFDEEPEDAKKADDKEPDLVSTPNFVVEVTKQDSKYNLVLDCHYPEDEIGHGDHEESDIFSIREVSFQPNGETDWKETSYTLSTDSLDWALYDHLMDFLADRGIDNTFADELMELSTALEHQEYIKFLEELKRFVKCQ